MIQKNRTWLNLIFVLGCDSNGLGVIRSLAESKLRMDIIGVDSNKNVPGLYSRFLNERFIISDPNESLEKAGEDLIQLAKRFEIKPVIIITSDIFIVLFNNFREQLAEYFIFNLPDKDLLNKILDKSEQYKLISRIGYDLPRTIFCFYKNDFQLNEEINFPVFIKGTSPYLWKQYFVEKGFVVNNKTELINKLNELKKIKIDLVLQEIILGPNCNHYKVNAFYIRTGEPKLFFTTQKARQFPFDFGVGSFMVSKVVKELIEKGKFYFDSLKYTGIGSIEFKRDERDGKYKFIELNPRMWQQNYQATAAGLNFAEAYYLDCIGKNVEYSDNFKENISYVDTVNDFQSFVKNKVITGQSYVHWIKQILIANCYAIWRNNDPLPIIKSSNYGLKLFRYVRNLVKEVFK